MSRPDGVKPLPATSAPECPSWCAGTHRPDGLMHVAMPELYPLGDGSALMISVIRDDRPGGGSTKVQFRHVAEPGTDKSLGRGILQTIWDANRDQWMDKGYQPVFRRSL